MISTITLVDENAVKRQCNQLFRKHVEFVIADVVSKNDSKVAPSHDNNLTYPYPEWHVQRHHI